MAKYTIKSVIKLKDRESSFGKMSDYALAMVDESGKELSAQQSKKTDSPAPVAGEVHGTIEETQWGLKFKPEAAPFAPRGGATQGGGFTPKSPEERASIERQVALKAAVEFANSPARKTAMKINEVMQVAQIMDDFLKHGKTTVATAAPMPEHPADEVQQHPDEAPTPLEAKINQWKPGDAEIDLSELPFGME